jgi:hypothetical protein
MVVDYLYVFRPHLGPSEADPVLVIDSNAVLSLPVARESLETIPWWDSEIL